MVTKGPDHVIHDMIWAQAPITDVLDHVTEPSSKSGYFFQLVHLLEDELRPYLPSALWLMVTVYSLEEGPHPE
ncbi:hypothetical protein TKK_0013578 [Trichogramma kaykai]